MRKGMFFAGVLLVCVGAAGLGAVVILGSRTAVPAVVSVPANVGPSTNTEIDKSSSAYSNLMRNLVTDFSKPTYASPGEQIFLSGIDATGVTLTATFVGTGMPMQGMMNRHLACANCHGQNGRGGFLFPDGTTKSADIRWSELTAAGYDDAKFARAVTQGEDAAGQPLSGWMPRWKISDTDLNDLAAYLRTL